MRRDLILKIFSSLFKKNDVVVVSGASLCSDIKKFTDSENFIFFGGLDISLVAGFVLGLAFGTPKRVFLVCDDYNALCALPAMGNLAVSRAANIFVLVMVHGVCLEVPQCVSLSSTLYSLKGVFFNLGFKAYSYTGHFLSAAKARDTMANVFKNLKGPAAGFIELPGVGSGKPLGDSNIPDTFKEFVVSDLGTSLFNPPFVSGALEWQNSSSEIV